MGGNYTLEKYGEQIQRSKADPNGKLPLVAEKTGPSIWDSIKDTYFSGNYWKRFGEGADVIIDKGVETSSKVVEKVADSALGSAIEGTAKTARSLVWGVASIVGVLGVVYIFSQMK